MNYIARLEADKAELAGQNKALTEGIHDLRSYLISDKFAADNTVQCRDVLTRLMEILSPAPEYRSACPCAQHRHS